MQYFYGTYSDGACRTDAYTSLPDAVRAMSRDIMGHTLVHIKDEYNKVVWAIEGGFYPNLPMSERAIENASGDGVIAFIEQYKDHLFQSIIKDPKTGAIALNTGASASYYKGVITIKDATGKPRKILKVSVESVELVKHKFSKQLICETCNKHMGEIPEPAGLCEQEG